MKCGKLVTLAVLTVAAHEAASPAHAFSCEPGPYIIFFDPGTAQIMAEPFAILEDARQKIGVCGVGKVFIAAHTDTLEDDALSKKRAKVVRAYWIGHGVPREDIVVKAFGSTQPLIATGPNVSETRNRRVEITFGPSKGWP